MPKKQFKYFKPRYVKKQKVPKSVVGTISLLLVLSVLVTLLAFQGTPVTMNDKADPAVWKCLTTGGSLPVTVVYRNKLDVKLKTFKQWNFGNLHIAYAYADAKTLKELVQSSNVLRVSSWVKIGLPPYEYVVKRAGVKYDFSKDYKRIYHNANQRWMGDGVTVAIIDTGIDYMHPDFYRNGTTVIKALVSTIYTYPNGTPIVVKTEGFTREQMMKVLQYELKIRNETHGNSYVFEDAVGHGTHVAGIIAGQGIASSGRYMGIAPHAKLVVIKAFYDTNGGWASDESILDALQWVYNHSKEYNIKVLSCSWGCPAESPYPTPIELAMEQLVKDKGITIFCACGNEGAIPSTVISPARDPYVFAVGAIDPYDNKLAVFSSLGNPLPPPFNRPNNTKPDFVGAGVDIISPASEFATFPKYAIIHGHGGNYVIMSGTSMATPCCAAVYADFYEYWVATHGKPPTRQDFINYVRHHGIVYDPFGKDFLTGWGAPTVPPPN